MRISGAGITAFDIKILPKYKTNTTYAFKHVQVATGKYKVADRGVNQDIREADITIKGKIEDIEIFLEEVRSNRNSGNELVLSDINNSEKIFGEDVDYISIDINATILKLSEIKNPSFNVFTLDISLRLLPGALFVGTPLFPILSRVYSGYTTDDQWGIIKQDSYNGTFTYIEGNNDVSYFTCKAVVTRAEMRDLLRFRATNRGKVFVFNVSQLGIQYPFGKRNGSGNKSATLLKLESEGLRGLDNYNVSFKIAI